LVLALVEAVVFRGFAGAFAFFTVSAIPESPSLDSPPTYGASLLE
jgi:hypothetical protein